MRDLAFADRAEIDRLQQAKFADLVARTVPANGFYRAKWSDAGVLGGGELRRFPFTTKAELLADQEANPPFGTALNQPAERYTRFHQTSGTRGRPLRWLDTDLSWQALKNCWRQVFSAAGLTPGRERLFFPFSFGPFLGFWTAFEAADSLDCLKVAAGGTSSLARLRLLLDIRATVVFCTPTYALHLAQVARDHGIDLGPETAGYAVHTLIVAGEPGGNIPATRQRIESAWHARVIDHHGMTEVGPMSVECREAPGGLHILEGDYWVEVVDPRTLEPVAPGELGELIVTTLSRVDSPLFRYRTSDLVRVDPRPCPCGRSLVRLQGGILGRTDDMISIRGNNFYPGALEQVIRRFEEVVEYRVTIDESSALAELRIELEPAAEDANLAERVAQAVRDQLLFRADVRLVPSGSLPRFEMKANRFVRKL